MRGKYQFSLYRFVKIIRNFYREDQFDLGLYRITWKIMDQTHDVEQS